MVINNHHHLDKEKVDQKMSQSQWQRLLPRAMTQRSALHGVAARRRRKSDELEGFGTGLTTNKQASRSHEKPLRSTRTRACVPRG